MIKMIRRIYRTRKRMNEEIALLKKTLMFYADPQIYDDGAITARLDRGSAARHALIETTYVDTGMHVL